ncbi:hypothetical protein [Guyparkeria sp.]|uniref:hypothetical protein n=1 Tax=Guyparkeria sp. TaxID=2035736 RepID=UPI003970AE87
MSQMTIDQLKKERDNLDAFTAKYPERRSHLLAELQEAQRRLDEAELAAMRTGDDSGTDAERTAANEAQQKVLDLDRRYHLARQEKSRIAGEIEEAKGKQEQARYDMATKTANRVFNKLKKNSRIRGDLLEVFAAFAAVTDHAKPEWAEILPQAFPSPRAEEIEPLIEKKRAELDEVIS